MFLGELKTFGIDFTWDVAKTQTMTIKSIVVGSAQFDSLNIVPEQIPIEGKFIKDGKAEIKMTVQAPSDECTTPPTTAKCVNIRTYVIPISIIVQSQDGVNYGPYSSTLAVDIIKQVQTGTGIIIVVLAVSAVSIAGIIVRSSKPKRPTTPKQHKKAKDRVMQKINIVPKKPILKRLFS